MHVVRNETTFFSRREEGETSFIEFCTIFAMKRRTGKMRAGEREKRTRAEENETPRAKNIKMQQYERGNFGAQSSDRSLLQRRGRKQTRNTHKNSILGKQNRKKRIQARKETNSGSLSISSRFFIPPPFCLAASLP